MEKPKIGWYWYRETGNEVVLDGSGEKQPLLHVEGEEILVLVNDGTNTLLLETLKISDGRDLLRFSDVLKWGMKSIKGDKITFRVIEDGSVADFTGAAMTIEPGRTFDIHVELGAQDTGTLDHLQRFKIDITCTGLEKVSVSPGYVTGPKRVVIDFDLPVKQRVKYPGGEIEVPVVVTANHVLTFDPRLLEIEKIGPGEKLTFYKHKTEKIEIIPSVTTKPRHVFKFPVVKLPVASGKESVEYKIVISYGDQCSAPHSIVFEREPRPPEILQPFLEFKNAAGEALDIPMVGREKNKKEMQKFLRGDKPVLFIFGASGVGKTRFVLETLDQSFLETTDMPGKTAVYRVRYEQAVFNSGNITEAFQWFITAHGDTAVVLLMDDWHEYDAATVSQVLREVIEQQKVNVKLVITAWESSRKQIDNMFLTGYMRGLAYNKCQRVQLELLSKEQWVELLKSSGLSEIVTSLIVDLSERQPDLFKGYPDRLIQIIELLKTDLDAIKSISDSDPLYYRFNQLWKKIGSDKQDSDNEKITTEQETLQLLSLLRSIDADSDTKLITDEQFDSLDKLLETELIIGEESRYTVKRSYIGDYVLRFTLLKESPRARAKLNAWIKKYVRDRSLDISISIIKLQYLEDVAKNVDIAVKCLLDALGDIKSPKKEQLFSYLKTVLHIQESYQRKKLYRQEVVDLLLGFSKEEDILEDTKTSHTLARALEILGELKSTWKLVKRMLAIIKEKEERAPFLDIGGLVKWQQGELETASKLLVSASKIYASTGNREGEARTLNNLGNVRREQGKIAVAVKMFQKAELIHRQEGNKPGEAAAMVNLAGVKAMQGDMTGAHRLLQNARIINPLLENELGTAETLANIASAKFREGDLPGSLKLKESVLEMLENTGNKTGQARVTGDIALIKRYQGEYGAAYRLHEKTRGLFQELGDRLGEARALNGMGQVKEELRELEEAYRLYEEALAICKEKGAASGIAACLGNMANVKKKTEKFNEALELYREAMQKFKEIGDKNGEATQLGNMGNIKLVKHDLTGAAGLYQEALEIYQQTGNKIGEGRQLGNLGLVKRTQGQLEEAAGLHEKAVAIQQEKGFKAEEAMQLGNLAAVRRMQDRNEEAYQLFGRARGIFRDIDLRKEEFRCLILMVQLELEDGNASKACKLLEQASLVARQIGYQEGINECAYLKFTNCQ